jgi:putative protease
MAKNPIGTVTHYFGKPKVGIVALAGRVTTGDTVRFLGHGADFKQKIKSMQIDHVAVETASARSEVGIKVNRSVREGTKMYKVSPADQGLFAKLKQLFTN